MGYKGKYELAKYLVQIKSRIAHQCDKCGAHIEPGDIYFKEKIDMRPPPSLVLREFCIKCGGEMLANESGVSR